MLPCNSNVQFLACFATAVSYERKSYIQSLSYGKYKLDQFFMSWTFRSGGKSYKYFYMCRCRVLKLSYPQSGKPLKVVWDEFSTLSLAVLLTCMLCMAYTHTCPHLELKTRPRFCPVKCSLSMPIPWNPYWRGRKISTVDLLVLTSSD